jgi:hypothetical protein
MVHRWSGVCLALAVMMVLTPALRAQVTDATISGAVTDPKGAVVQGASVQVINDATGIVRPDVSNKDGLFSVPNLTPGTYTVKVTATGFAPKEITGIDVHGGDSVKVPTFALAVGSVTDTVTVSSVAGQVMTTDNGTRSETLTYSEVQDLALTGRDTTELLKVLPGVVQTSQTGFNDVSVTTGQSAIGQSLGINGAPFKGGTALNMDGADVIDIGDDFSSLATINPEMTQEVQVTTSAFGADTANGPNVINATGRSGGAHYHGEAYFNGRNDVFNANDWVDNHTGHAKNGASYYYPGGSFSGPIPYTHKKLFFFGALEYLIQDQGNANHVATYLPTPEMLKGDFTTDNPDNLILCPAGFPGVLPANGVTFPGSGTTTYGLGSWCQNPGNSLGNPTPTNFRDGTQPIVAAGSTAQGYSNGATIPQAYIDPNMADYEKVWPAWTSPFVAKTTQQIINNGGYNYYQPVVNHDNGWTAHGRVDYDWNSTNQFFVSYQQSSDIQLSGGCGTSLYGGCGALQDPRGLYKTTLSKVVNGHYVHIFSPTLTNEAIASWVWGNIPIVPQNPKAMWRSTLGMNFGCVYCTNPVAAPTFGAGGGAYPGITQADYFEPNNYYIVRKETPTFADNLTKVWGRHTVKIGGLTANANNYQGNQSVTGLQGSLTIGAGNATVYKNYFAQVGLCPVSVCAGYTGVIGSGNNTVNFLTGNLTSYGESNSSPVGDVAFQTDALYADDQIKVTSRFSLQVGVRFEHIGWWYDRQGNGLAVFYPNRVLPDFYAGKYAPGYYWHAIDSGVPLSGRPDRIGFLSPRFGVSYDVFGTGKTLVRGGWGAYRYAEYANGPQAALTTAQGAQSISASSLIPTNTSFLASQISLLSNLVPYCTSQCSSNGQSGFSPSNYGIPLVYSWNFTIDQRLPWKMLLDVGYVGNHAKNLADNGQDGTSSGGYDNQNKTPLGAYFAPDPVTGVTACNPENLAAACSPQNNARDYQPYGALHNNTKNCGGLNQVLNTYNNPNCLIYGTNSTTMTQNLDYQNYNALQVSLVKRAGPITLDANFTWSKSLGTVVTYDPFHISPNNTYDNLNRPYVFNSSYIYREPNFFHGNKIIGGAVNGWTISGISLWQKGTQTTPGISIQYDPTTLPASPNMYSLNSTTTGVGASTFFGTNAGISTNRPDLIAGCNPKAGLVKFQVYRPCFIASPFGQSGGQALPFVAGVAFVENDLAVYKTFTIHEQNKIQFRLSAFNWLNHPLPNFGSGESTTEYYYYSYTTHALYANNTCANGTVNAPAPTSSAPGSCNGSGAPYVAANSYSTPSQDPATLFGQMHYRQGAGGNSQRLMEFDLKYTF